MKDDSGSWVAGLAICYFVYLGCTAAWYSKVRYAMQYSVGYDEVYKNSARWRMKLSGHSYKVGRQTVATLLFWYAVFAVFVGLMMPLMERNTFGLTFGAAMIAIWSGIAYACKRWQQRLRTIERNRVTEA